ncbi:TVP38/TMEM64 family protein [Fuerstiella marisgermanici]|uniref:TVP38/TMEM64 family membrane protein n=1 Tax=Fuerstiella marisgermanici TaxID=1891926 RepID=A0A1P8WQL3_9PLAN|nr:VTT domain-containing protein [Fuerstiella marisgermanici]APZ96350.1 TVP38/TMEM64 family inner membrane protein YdjZ [Fuerstiella marisgermanici]
MSTLLRIVVAATVALMLIAVVWSWSAGGIVAAVLSPETTSEEKLQRLQQFFDDFGVWSPLVYVMFVTVEVVIAPIPGLMLYAPGGILFGPLLGGSLALIGNVLGAGIACSVTRSIGGSWLSRFFAEDKLERTQTLIESRGGWLVFLLRLNPLTSSDLVSYAAGFTRLPVWNVMIATAFGMAPLCYAQAWLSEGLITAYPWLIYPLIAACAAYMVAVVVVVKRLLLVKPAV